MAELYRITTEFRGVSGSPYFSTLYANKNFSTTAAVMGGIVGNFWDKVKAELWTGMEAEVLPEVDIVEDTTGLTTGVETWAGQTIAFENTTGVLPWTSQGLCRFRTGTYIGGRELRGRMFIPGFTENHSDLGKPVAATLTAWNGFVQDFVENGFVIFSPTHLTSSEIVSASMWSEWAILRSRRD